MMKDMFSHDKLIGRDDGRKFESKQGEERLREEYDELLRKCVTTGQGGDSTLNMKSFMKSLNSLSGGDDTIFAIIDDRFDVWI